jgi:hypothetical protein
MPFGEVHRWRGRSGVFTGSVASCGPAAVTSSSHVSAARQRSVWGVTAVTVLQSPWRRFVHCPMKMGKEARDLAH